MQGEDVKVKDKVQSVEEMEGLTQMSVQLTDAL